MHIRAYSQRCVLALLILFLPARGLAMDLPHYDLDSLVYMSTDIVLADISKDAHGNFTATVTEALYGSLRPGEKLDALAPFLMFFQPLNDGQKVILFLDRRPRQYDFFHQDAAKSPFAVPPSGVYLIDEYGHVHEYFQQNNPGPYVAQGYSFFIEHQVPTEKDDLALPSLQEVKARIAATVKSVIPIRTFLDQPTRVADVPALTKLLASRPRFPETCTVERYDAIASDIVQKIRSLNDPELSLRVWHLDRGAVPFPVAQESGSTNKGATIARVKFLIQTMGDRKRDAPLRIASLQILLNLSSFHSGPHSGPYKPLPIDNDWLASSADEIVTTGKAILDNPGEDPDLRALSLQFLDLNDPTNVADIRRVYWKTHSPELRFAIEQAFLEVSDELYQSLHPSSGPVASIIELAPEGGCAQPPDNQITFVIRFYSTRAFNDRGAVVITGRIVLKNIKSGQRFELKNVRSMGGHYGSSDGVLLFRLDQLSEFPAGVYTLGMEYAHQFNVLYSPIKDDVPSIGHTITIAISDSPIGKSLSIPAGDREKKQHNGAAERELAEYISAESPHLPTAPRGDPNFKVVYTVAGLTFPIAGQQHADSFQFTAPNFITSRISLSTSQLDSCMNCTQSGTSVQFFPKGSVPFIVAADSVRFTDADGKIYGWVFAPGAFSAAGTYTAINDPPYIVSDVATMTVQAVPGTSAMTRKQRSLKCLYLWKCATRVKTASRTTPP
ncbi:MAG TPA: hypothetical protein VGR72_02665 [Candidatus Acidoferrales bacterium]|nr:hypothetical protein [Candidatus Acidoferrales bacterium]